LLVSRCPSGYDIVVDSAARDLGVERRRIYDVVNILESIRLVSKEKKNTYKWMGLRNLDEIFGHLQAEAILEYPDDAKEFLGVSKESEKKKQHSKGQSTVPKCHSNKSLAKLSQEFLQVYLIGFKTLSLPEASDKIQGATSMEELISIGRGPTLRLNANGSPNHDDEKERKTAAARGLKTKIRRLYDIANVFISVGLLRKIDTLATSATRRPNFSWNYKLTAQEIRRLYLEGLTRKSAMVSVTKTFVSAVDEACSPTVVGMQPTETRCSNISPLSTHSQNCSNYIVKREYKDESESMIDDLSTLSYEEKHQVDGAQNRFHNPTDI
jgi:hypothetical protein